MESPTRASLVRPNSNCLFLAKRETQPAKGHNTIKPLFVNRFSRYVVTTAPGPIPYLPKNRYTTNDTNVFFELKIHSCYEPVA